MARVAKGEAAKGESKAPLSAQDLVSRDAADTTLDIWHKKDVKAVVDWIFEDGSRVPNDKVGAGGGRLYKLTNIIVSACPYAKDVLGKNTSVRMALLKEQERLVHSRYIAPLAKKCLVVIDRRMEQKKAETARLHDSDHDVDDFYD